MARLLAIVTVILTVILKTGDFLQIGSLRIREMTFMSHY